MSKDVILKIKAAEEEAAKIRADAENAAKEKVRNAHELGKLLCENTEEEATRVNGEKIRLTSEKADELLKRGREDSTAEAQELTKACMPHMEDAVKAIIGGIFEQCQ